MFRIVTILLGFLLLGTGIFCVANAGVAFISIAFLVGSVMILFGVIQSVIYIKNRQDDKKHNNLWIFADAITTLILGALILCDQLAADVAAPLVLGLWMICSGSIRLAVSYSIDREGKKANFYWVFFTGLACVLAGVFSFANMSLMPMPVVQITGMLFIVQAVCIFELGFHMPHSRDIVSDVQ